MHAMQTTPPSRPSLSQPSHEARQPLILAVARLALVLAAAALYTDVVALPAGEGAGDVVKFVYALRYPRKDDACPSGFDMHIAMAMPCQGWKRGSKGWERGAVCVRARELIGAFEQC